MKKEGKSLASIMTSQLPKGRILKKKCVSYSVRLSAYWQAKLSPDHTLKRDRDDISIPKVSLTDAAAQIPT